MRMQRYARQAAPPLWAQIAVCVKVALAEVGTAAVALPMGRRPPSIGFVAALARLLQERAPSKAALRTRLQVRAMPTCMLQACVMGCAAHTHSCTTMPWTCLVCALTSRAASLHARARWAGPWVWARQHGIHPQIHERVDVLRAEAAGVQAAPAWQEFAAGPEGALARLLAEQEGELAGPRPQRVAPGGGDLGAEGEGALGLGSGGGLPPGGIISGRDLLLLLQNMQGINVTSADRG